MIESVYFIYPLYLNKQGSQIGLPASCSFQFRCMLIPVSGLKKKGGQEEEVMDVETTSLPQTERENQGEVKAVKFDKPPLQPVPQKSEDNPPLDEKGQSPGLPSTHSSLLQNLNTP